MRGSSMRWRWALAAVVWLVGLFGVLTAKFVRGPGPLPSTIPSTKSVTAAKFADDVAPILDQYCTKCHAGAKPKANLALDKYKDELSVAADLRTWEKVARQVREREMPPPASPQPTSTEITFLTVWIDSMLAKFDFR